MISGICSFSNAVSLIDDGVERFRKVSRLCFGVSALACLSACQTAPAQDVLGSFFPSWLLCAALGAVVSAVLRAVLGVARIEDIVVLPMLTYLAVGLATTLGIWLIWFGH